MMLTSFVVALNLDDFPSDDSDDESFAPRTPSKPNKKSFSYPRGPPQVSRLSTGRSSGQKNKGTSFSSKKIGEHLIIMVQVFVPNDGIDLLYIFIPSVPVEFENITPKIIDGGQKVEIAFKYSRHVLGQIKEAIAGSEILSMELEKELKKMRSFSQDGEDLCTRIRIDLPFACEQQFYPEKLIGGGGRSCGFQTLLGSNGDRNPVPIFQMCLCKVKDSYSSKKTEMNVRVIGQAPFSPPTPGTNLFSPNRQSTQQAQQQSQQQSQQQQYFAQQQAAQQAQQYAQLQIQQQQAQRQQAQRQVQEQVQHHRQMMEQQYIEMRKNMEEQMKQQMAMQMQTFLQNNQMNQLPTTHVPMKNIQMENNFSPTNFSTSSFLGEDESMKTNRTNKSNKRPKKQGNKGEEYEPNRVQVEDASDSEQEKVQHNGRFFTGFVNNIANSVTNHIIGENAEGDDL